MLKKLFRTPPLAGFAFGAVLALALPVQAQKNWPPISSSEMALKVCEQQPGASAIYLYRERIRDIEHAETRILKRLKILTDAGRDRANIEIIYPKGVLKVNDLEARVVPPEGEPRPFTGEVFEKTAIRVRGIRVSVKSFALPDVGPGCIIDYRYKLAFVRGGSAPDSEDVFDALQIRPGKPKEGDIGRGTKMISFPVDAWDLQEDLFTLRARFVFIQPPFMGLVLAEIFDGPGSLMWFTKKLTDSSPVIKENQLELTVDDIPAFEAEESMTPEESERMGVNVFYFDTRFRDPDAYWKRECANWQKAAESFIGDSRKLAQVSAQVIGDETDPRQKLMKLYARTQQIRNLSYKTGLGAAERKAQGLKNNRRAAEVLERDYGYRSDITRTFVALARAVGFEAEVARVSTRDDKLFHVNYLSFAGQFDSELALIKVGDRELVFDPATPFCPFGLVHWIRTNTAAVRYSDTPPAFFMTSLYPPDLALTQREVALRLDPGGNLAGTVKTTYQGHEALVRRLDHIEDDREEIRKSLEEELTGLLPMGAAAAMTKLENMDNNAAAVVVEYDVTIPGLVTSAGERMLLPVSPLLGTGRYPFRHTERKYPVYIPFPYREFNDIIITLPEGVAVEARPEPRKSDQDFSSYSLVCVQEDPQKIHVQRDLVIKKSYYPVEKYPTLKAFYDAVRTSDEEQIVLVKVKK